MELKELEQFLKDNKEALDAEAHTRRMDFEQRVQGMIEEFAEREKARKVSEEFLSKTYDM